jgi:hypothetical protein
MVQRPVHECCCQECQGKDRTVTKMQHQHMNLLMSRLDEQQRRWYAAIESEKLGYGGDVQVSRITGLNVETIRRGRREIAANLAQRPIERIRSVGGGRPRVEKKA